MVQVVPLKVAHVKELQELGALTYLSDYITDDTLAALEKQKFSFSVLNDAGRAVACGGALYYWPGRYELWAFFDPSCKRDFLGIHNAVKRFIAVFDYRRLEATVDHDFEAGHRWIKLLGFELEAERLRSYTVDGRDVSLYSLIKE